MRDITELGLTSGIAVLSFGLVLYAMEQVIVAYLAGIAPSGPFSRVFSVLAALPEIGIIVGAVMVVLSAFSPDGF